MADADVHGVLIVDKPLGPTSHDVVARVRKLLKTRAVGHAGTLDPMATGVLVIAVGEATKLVPWLTADDKGYRATIRLGTATSSHDAQGEVTQTMAIPEEVIRWANGDPQESIDIALRNERERALQVPPAVSAIRIDGVRAHELARAGLLDEATLPSRPVKVHALEVEAVRLAEGAVEIDVAVETAKGYFVRSLARDLAAALGTVGHLTALRRTRSGGFTLADAVALDAVAPASLLSVDLAAARALPVTRLDDAGVRAVSFGQRVTVEQMSEPQAGPSAWLDAAGHLVAVGERQEDGTGKVLRGFPRTV